jgi:NADH:ubiquinone oxidoreductase subunit F (NADH-binding)
MPLSAKSILIKDTTREERMQIVRKSLQCAEGCENCTGCQLGVGDAMQMYQAYIDGKMEIRDINRRFQASYGIH